MNPAEEKYGETGQKPNEAAVSGSARLIAKKIAESKEDLTFKWNKFKVIFNLLYQGVLKISISISIMLIVWQSLVDTFEDKVVFEPFVLPPALEEQGYTGALLVQEITDRINRIREQVKKSDQEKFIKIETMEQGANIQVPGTGLSLKELTDFIRSFLGTGVRSISGNVVVAEDQLLLTVRAPDRFGVTFKGELNNLTALLQPTAEHILKNLDPFTLGKYYSIQQNIPAMEKLIEYIQANNPGTTEIAIAHLIAGLSLFDQEDYEGALQEWNMAALLEPENINAFVYQGWALDQQGQFKEAIEKYKKVLKLDPNNVSAYNNWGITLYIMKEFEESILKFRKLIELAPDYPHGYNNIGYSLFELGKYSEGIEHIKRAINLDPKEPGFYNSLGEGLLALEKYQEAIAQFKQTIKLDPENAEAYYLWGQVLSELRRQEDAEEKFAKATALDPEQY
jgi:tetratricopeptide (TPR) repeat protein